MEYRLISKLYCTMFQVKNHNSHSLLIHMSPSTGTNTVAMRMYLMSFPLANVHNSSLVQSVFLVYNIYNLTKA